MKIKIDLKFRKRKQPSLKEILKRWRLSAREQNDIDTSKVPQETEGSINADNHKEG